ncbi:hypothetical protein Tco_0763471 [Tanacetum coccineum]
MKECTNWKDKKKDKEQEALLISEDTAFVITGENVGPKPKPGDMGAEMCVLGYGSGGMVQRKWSMGCGSGVVLYLVVLYGVWFRGCGSRGLVKRLG